ncbi:hypothetical protein JW758_02640 [Candidatus Peregrinibacteria bacterium]|nr:hypothetical protein [Candidatus Peregrinibacteria bacterium]
MPPNTAKQRRIETFEQNTQEMGKLYNEIEALREQEEKLARKMEEVQSNRDRITELHLRDSSVDLQAREREIVVEDLISYCIFDAKQRQRWGSALSPGLVSKLNECYKYNIDPEFVTSILFIFGMIGSHIDLENIKNLDYEKPEDRGVIEELMGILNDETNYAIETCRQKMPTNLLDRLYVKERLRVVKRLMDDFNNPKQKYLEQKGFLDLIAKEETKHQEDEDRANEDEVKVDAGYWMKTTLPAPKIGLDEKLTPDIVIIPEAGASDEEKLEIAKEVAVEQIEISLDSMKLSPKERVEILKQLLSEAKKTAKKKKNVA